MHQKRTIMLALDSFLYSNTFLKIVTNKITLKVAKSEKKRNDHV